jgi:hypothetical protein
MPMAKPVAIRVSFICAKIVPIFFGVLACSGQERELLGTERASEDGTRIFELSYQIAEIVRSVSCQYNDGRGRSWLGS